MSVLDLDEFVAWLHLHGVRGEHLELYRQGAALVLRQVDVDDAMVRDVHIDAVLQAEAEAGASPRRLANLQAIGARLQVFAAELQGQAPAPLADEWPTLELADVPRGSGRRARLSRISQAQLAADDPDSAPRGTMVDDLAPPPSVPTLAPVSTMEAPGSGPPSERRRPSTTAPPVGSRPSVPALPVPFTDGPRPGVLAGTSRAASLRDQRPLPGCVCRTRSEVYADDLWSMWGKVYLFATTAVGFVLALMWSRVGSMAVAMAIVGLGALATAASPGWRCTDCQRWIERPGLDGEQRRDQRRRTITFAVLGALLSVGCVVAVVQLRAERAEERRTRRVLQDLKSTDDAAP